MESWEDDESAAEDALDEGKWRYQGGKDATLFVVDATDAMHEKDDKGCKFLVKALKAVCSDLKGKIFQVKNKEIYIRSTTFNSFLF